MYAKKLFKYTAAVLLSAACASAFAQETKIKFQLDWRFEGPSALFLVAKSKGYFAQEKLDVIIDAGSGSGNAVNRVASGTYDMGFADGRTDGIHRQQSELAGQADGRDDGLQRHARRHLLTQENRYQNSCRSGRQETGLAGI
jgi:hypothetical protein